VKTDILKGNFDFISQLWHFLQSKF